MTGQAASLTWTATADNAFALYVSTSDSVLGNLVFNNTSPVPNDANAGQWSTAFSGSYDLSSLGAATSYFIHVVGTNYSTATGYNNPVSYPPGPGNGNPDGFLGQFAIGSATNLTNVTDWLGRAVTDTSTWIAPIDAALSLGANGVGPWGLINPISSLASWIWSNPNNGQYAFLSTEIAAPPGGQTGETPIPAALPLFASGAGLLGLLGWRRKRKAQAANAA